MKTDSHQLLNALTGRMNQVLKTANAYRELSAEQLNHKPTIEKWSILECLEHLNLYGDYYLPEIEKSIVHSPKSDEVWFKSGLIGNYFANLMRPKADGTLKKMKSPKDKIPAISTLSVITIDRFIKQTEHLLNLLQLAATTNLTKAKTPVSISKWIRLRLGDTFRFYIYHIERHIAQAEEVLKNQSSVL